MPRMIEIKSGNNLTIAGPANVRVWGKPTLSGTQPVPGDYEPADRTDEHSNHPESHKSHHKNSRK